MSFSVYVAGEGRTGGRNDEVKEIMDGATEEGVKGGAVGGCMQRCRLVWVLTLARVEAALMVRVMVVEMVNVRTMPRGVMLQ